MRFAVVSVALIGGCGRVDFAELRDAAPDAGPATVTGRTFRYTSFTNQVAALDAVTVELQRSDGSVVAMTTSDADGNYTLTAPVGDLHFRYTRATYEPTLAYSDAAFDRDIIATAQPLFAFGDGPLWQSSAVSSVYMAAGVPRDATKGTLNIGLRDADGNAVEGVSVTVDPPTGAATYQASDGTPEPTLTATVGPFAHYIALNAVPGLTRVTATKGGLLFGELTLVVGEQGSTLAIIHGTP